MNYQHMDEDDNDENLNLCANDGGEIDIL